MTVRIENQAEPIPGYRLIERLGGGGFGEVWKCEAPGGLHKAIKFVFGDLDIAGDNGQRAEQELKALKRVQTVRHPYILSLERYDIINGQLLIVMELADRNLWDRFKECRAQGLQGIPREELLGYMRESAEALDLMNIEYQLQHLDIKPQNLFLVHNHVKVADFGLVKDLEGTQASVTGGVTPVYAAPETFDGVVKRSSDQYSLAIVYQELLTGQRPFAGTNVRQLILQHLQAPPNLNPLPPADRPIIGRALAKTHDERFPTCREMVEALRAASGRESPSPIPADILRVTAAATAVLAPSRQLEGAPEKIRREFPINTPPPGPQETEGGQDIDQEEEAVQTARLRGRPGDTGSHPTDSLRGSEPAVLRTAVTPSRPVKEEKRGDGILFPALVIGLGQMGMTVLQRLGDSIQAHLGSRQEVPNVRLLLLDTDPEVVRAATRGRGSSLAGGDILLTPLNRPSHYLKPRDGRTRIDTWLNPRMLYRIPRSQVTTGVRALGRLAFCENYRSVVRRLQSELEACLDPEALKTAAERTGLGWQTDAPRVYVVSCLAGGTGSGVFLDLTYTVRALLRQMGYENPDVVGLFLLPPVDRNRTRVMALGNTYAALRELQYFSHPDTCFTGRYHEREAPVEDRDPPFRRTVLLPLPEETDEVATREVIELAGQLLFRELTTPLGVAAELGRADLATPLTSPNCRCQTVGLYRLTWPRHVFLQAAARQLCRRLVQRWMSKDSKPMSEAVQLWVQEKWQQFELGAESFIEKLQDSCDRGLEEPTEVAFKKVLEPIVRRVSGREAPEAPSKRGAATAVTEIAPEEVAAVLTEVEALLGKPGDDASDPTGTVARALRDANGRLLAVWGQKLAELPVRLIEEPDFRLAGAEEAVRQMVASIEQILQHHEPLVRELTAKANEAHTHLRILTKATHRSGNTTVKRPVRSAAEVLEYFRSYTKSRYQALILQQVASAFVGLRGHLSDELREINFCRVRLTELQRLFEQNASATNEWSAAEAQLALHLFPAGCKDMDEAVKQFLTQFGPNDLRQLDEHMEAMIRKQFTALVNICLTTANVLRNVEQSMLEVARDYAACRVGGVDVAEMFFEQNPDEEQAGGSVESFYEQAVPDLGKRLDEGESELAVLAIPESEAGDRFRDLVERTFPQVVFQLAGSCDDILFYRERTSVPLASLEQLGPVAEDAYRQMSATENFTPHSRTDIEFTP